MLSIPLLNVAITITVRVNADSEFITLRWQVNIMFTIVLSKSYSACYILLLLTVTVFLLYELYNNVFIIITPRDFLNIL